MTSLKIDKRIFKKYYFYGNEDANIKPLDNKYRYIGNLYSMYDALEHIWSIDTCAPRLRDKWSPKNKTLGQCSIT